MFKHKEKPKPSKHKRVQLKTVVLQYSIIEKKILQNHLTKEPKIKHCSHTNNKQHNTTTKTKVTPNEGKMKTLKKKQPGVW